MTCDARHGAVVAHTFGPLLRFCVLLQIVRGEVGHRGGLATRSQFFGRVGSALGISEVSDAVAVVVSEETGAISVAHNGRMIQRLDASRLRHILAAFYRPRGSGSGFLNGLRRVLRWIFRQPPPQDGD